MLMAENYHPGLFTGQLELLLTQKRHTAHCMELMYQLARDFGTDPLITREHLSKITTDAMNQYHKHMVECHAFIEKWGERIELKDEFK
jgi:hypothetical protein